MKSYIEKADIFSVQPYFFLTAIKESSKSLLGGLLSIMSLSLISSCVLYFLVMFLSRSNYKIVSNQEINDEVYLKSINDYPIMFRVTDNNALVPDNATLYTKIRMAYCSSEFNPKTGIKQHLHYFLEMETCDINKHFGQYKNLFENMTDLSTFTCPNWGTINEKFNKSIDLNRVYGSPKEYTFLHLFVSACDNKTDFPVVCKRKSEIDAFLTSPFFEYRYIDHKINSNSIVPNIAFVSGERESFSPSIFKRIWLYWKQSTYVSDFGFIFQDMSSTVFVQTDYIKIDIDLHDWRTQSLEPGSFLWFTLSNSKRQDNYLREFLKSQEFLASVGGIIKGITTIGYLLSWLSSNKNYYEELIKLLGISSIIKGNDTFDHKTASGFTKINNLTSNSTKNISPDSKLMNPTLIVLEKRQTFTNLAGTSIELSLLEKLLPFCLTRQSYRKEVHRIGTTQIKDLINLGNFIKISRELDGLKETLLDKSQIQLFDFVFKGGSPISKGLNVKLVEQTCNQTKKDKITERLKELINN